jgi:limonene-1,2-epoxide hydrolase
MNPDTAEPTEVVKAFRETFEAFEADDGKITVWREYFDLATVARIHDAGA